jgi:hypothetical protein
MAFRYSGNFMKNVLLIYIISSVLRSSLNLVLNGLSCLCVCVSSEADKVDHFQPKYQGTWPHPTLGISKNEGLIHISLYMCSSCYAGRMCYFTLYSHELLWCITSPPLPPPLLPPLPPLLVLLRSVTDITKQNLAVIFRGHPHNSFFLCGWYFKILWHDGWKPELWSEKKQPKQPAIAKQWLCKHASMAMNTRTQQ